MIDIKLDSSFQLINKKDDLAITTDTEGLLQYIKVEAASEEGELFYDEEYGWSLHDFVHSNIDDLTKIEISQRCKTKMSKYNFVNQNSVSVNITYDNDNIDKIIISISFQFSDEDYETDIQIVLDRVNIEVIVI